MDGIAGSSVELIVIAVVLHDKAVDVDAIGIVLLAGEQLDCWFDRGHGVTSLGCDDSDMSLVALDTDIVGRVMIGINGMATVTPE